MKPLYNKTHRVVKTSGKQREIEQRNGERERERERERETKKETDKEREKQTEGDNRKKQVE